MDTTAKRAMLALILAQRQRDLDPMTAALLPRAQDLARTIQRIDERPRYGVCIQTEPNDTVNMEDGRRVVRREEVLCLKQRPCPDHDGSLTTADLLKRDVLADETVRDISNEPFRLGADDDSPPLVLGGQSLSPFSVLRHREMSKEPKP